MSSATVVMSTPRTLRDATYARPSVTRPFFIDTDTASDDAVALVMALREPSIEVVGIGVVAGNVPLDQAVQNALYTRELCGSDVPVYAGCDAPLQIPLETAQKVHGRDGMGDIGLPLHGRVPDPGHAVDMLLEASHRHAGELTLVTLGPLTNIAVALQRDPSLPSRLARVVTMGAVADHIGNMSPVAEYNMWADPHAVQVVLDAGLPITFVGWDVSRFYAVMTPHDAEDLARVGTPVARFCVEIQGHVAAFCHDQTKLKGFDLPDPIAMAVAIDPAVATDVRQWFAVTELDSPITRGMVVFDTLGFMGHEPNCHVVVAADRQRFLDMLHAAVR
jgi:purine nucleosidase